MSQLNNNKDENQIISVEGKKPTKNKNRKVGEIVPASEFPEEFHKEFPEVGESSQLPKPVVWNYNRGTYDSYIKNHLTPPESLDRQEREFLRDVKIDKKPILKEVTRIFRIRIRGIDYLYWYENWFGVDWLGQKVSPVSDHLEGIYMEQEMSPVVHNMRLEGYERSGEHPIYYVPFSKSKLDEIIASSTYKNTVNDIQLIVKGQTQRTGKFSYEQFCDSSFDELVEMQMTDGGPEVFEYHRKKTLKKQQELLKNSNQYH